MSFKVCFCVVVVPCVVCLYSPLLCAQHLILPEQHPPHTDLLNLQPLATTALFNKQAEQMYTTFTHFNPIQTQVSFRVLLLLIVVALLFRCSMRFITPMRTFCWALLQVCVCPPLTQNELTYTHAGSGKTIVAELAILRLFALSPQLKVVYIAPMKALARERIDDWSTQLDLCFVCFCVGC